VELIPGNTFAGNAAVGIEPTPRLSSAPPQNSFRYKYLHLPIGCKRPIPSVDRSHLSWIERGDSTGVASTVAMTEVLVGPYRDADEQRVADSYGLLSTYPNLDWIAPDLEIADLAANLRAVHRLQTPDALHAATAIRRRATGLITNDAAFEKVDAFETLVLDRLL
jgi:predicted nucleic acid-binding protein